MHRVTCLGSVITSDALIDAGTDFHLSKASAAFGRLYKRVWNDRYLKISTKIAVHRAIVVTTLLYGSESWTLYRRQVENIDAFHMRCLRSVLGIK